jgi:hypothetical protein
LSPSPPTDPSGYLQGRSRETTIRRDAQGRWFHDGDPLEHPNLVRSFDRWIERAQDGRYCLKNDINWAYVTIEGPPMFVRAVRFDAHADGRDGGGADADGVRLVLSNDREEGLVPDTLRQGEDGALYCDVAGGTMVARFDRHAQAQLARVLGEDAGGVYLGLAGARVRPPVVRDPLAPRA